MSQTKKLSDYLTEYDRLEKVMWFRKISTTSIK